MSAQKSKKKTHSAMTRERITTYGLFCLPGFIAYCVFLIFPILMGIYYSFMDWNGISKGYNFIGFANYAKLLTDKKFGAALLFNFRYTIMLIVGVVVISVVLALLLNKEFKGRSFFRTLYFLPAVLSMITVSLVFKQVFFYVLPAIGKALGIEALSTNILASKQNAIYGVLFVHLWQGVALPTLLFLAGLQTIPTELYEAAAIDGANGWQQFKHITVAYLIPTLSVVLVLLVKQGLMVFDYVKSMTAGGPGTATQTIALLIYNNGFERNRYSYSIAQAIATGVIIALISAIQIQASNRKKVD
ncbi:MAG: sugar ABC transporter permease [Candidatus Limiplasma sp.]|jgi:raffinose/stachyose/melibiose transport system permease protein|nr:sugar ABC transporter permease [Clostridiales bacterium]MDY3244392.1 sugar ABC transporter permease [Candidatus Limiplasma sp.]MDY4061428.1 sugar ABC transporter permease [Candidatus Limiplasma sp.]